MLQRYEKKVKTNSFDKKMHLRHHFYHYPRTVTPFLLFHDKLMAIVPSIGANLRINASPHHPISDS
jgi:hypothetical protein